MSTTVPITSPTGSDSAVTVNEWSFTRSSLVPQPAHRHFGLINQGATCYLNSFLQTLFMTPEMRHMILTWKFDPATSGKPHLSILLQLQKLFLRLLYGHSGAVSTKQLTDSFGWTNKEIWQQHDVQEFIQKLYERIQQDPKAKETVYQLNHGMSIDYVHCETCHSKRETPIPFLTLPLDCKNLKSIEASLSAFIQAERLEGSNAYMCRTCGTKQPALKGVAFTQFPPILSCQLKRFDMDWNTMARIKITSPIKIGETLQTAPFLRSQEKSEGQEVPASSAAPSESVSTEYELFSILIHTGSANGGHYFCFTKDLWEQYRLKQEALKAGVPAVPAAPDSSIPLDKIDSHIWFEYNDTSVTPLTLENVQDIFSDPYAPKPKPKRVESTAAAVVPIDVPTETLSTSPPTAPPSAPPMAPGPHSAPPMAPSLTTAAPPSAPPLEPAMTIPNAPPSTPPMAPPPAPPMAPPMAPSMVPNAPPTAPSLSGSPPPPPGPPAAPSFSSPSRLAPTASGKKPALSFLADFAATVPEAPDLETVQLERAKKASIAAGGVVYASTGPASNAYMLVYRRIMPDDVNQRILQPIDWRQHVSPDLLAELEAENAAFDQYAEQIKLDDSFLSLNVFYPTDEKGMIEKTVKLPFASSLNDLIAAAVQTLIPSSLTSSSADILRSYRLRQFDSKIQPRRVGEYYADNAEPAHTLAQLGFRNNAEVWLQPAVIQDGLTTFPPVEVAQIQLKFLRFDSNAMKLTPPSDTITISLPYDANLSQLQTRLVEDGRLFSAESGGQGTIVDPTTINLVLSPLPSQIKIDSVMQEVRKLVSPLTPVEKVLGGNLDQTILVEILPSAANVDTESLLVPWLQLQTHLITIGYNSFDSIEINRAIEIDDRLTLKELKQRLSTILELPVDEFRLLREYQNVEYKDLNKTLALLNIREIGSIFVEKGQPMKLGDYLFRIFRYDLSLVPKPGSPEWDMAITYDEENEPMNSPEELAFYWIGDCILNESMTFEEVTQAIAKLPTAPPANLMRLRDKLENTLTNIWFSDRTVKQNCPGPRDCYPLVFQVLTAPEIITSQDLLINLRFWLPGRLELKEKEEVVVSKKMKVGELKELIAKRVEKEHLSKKDSSNSASSDSSSSFSLVGDDFDVLQVQLHECRELSMIPTLNWSNRVPDSALISGSPWRLRHGDTILYKLKAGEKLGSNVDRATDPATKALLWNMQFGGSTNTSGSITAGVKNLARFGGGPELKLFSADEIDLREQMEIEAQIMATIKKDEEAKALKANLDRLKEEPNK